MFPDRGSVPSYCEQSLVRGPVQDWGPDLPPGKGQDGTCHLRSPKEWTSTELLWRVADSFRDEAERIVVSDSNVHKSNIQPELNDVLRLPRRSLYMLSVGLTGSDSFTDTR